MEWKSFTQSRAFLKAKKPPIDNVRLRTYSDFDKFLPPIFSKMGDSQNATDLVKLHETLKINFGFLRV